MGAPGLEVADIFRAHGPAWRQAQHAHLSLGERISASIGVAGYPEAGVVDHELLRMADLAMYQAKDAGKGQVICAGVKTDTGD